ncbi:winged helix-turn-helix domain-containing protein [Robbsia sp. Bb-Pol-6]|uniref:Winged helix-turn-helix domain-containing protein n=1 Tax=Robbsia betulipollinis TaxID=2981849 RepID=A0ABT3ZHQ2_9BURK|nr:winged helix-turn-helix domain-containing protein [Robbsia betulipollinis]MCY0386051.1 winged helix-turn-helix domain-containing protein [Robbsia betulipollinis]
MNLQILLVGPTREWSTDLVAFLGGHGVDVLLSNDPAQLMRRVALDAPALILLCDNLPGATSVGLLEALRQAGCDTSVIMLGERVDAIEKIICLELGADDYLDMPCNPRELLSRIRNVMRHRPRTAPATGATADASVFGDFRLDIARRALLRNGTFVSLQGSAFALLQLFVEHPMKVLSRASLITLLQGRGSGACERSLDVLVCRLRRVIETDPGQPRFIQTVRGHGYVFNPRGGDSAGAPVGNGGRARAVASDARRAASAPASRVEVSGKFFQAPRSGSVAPAVRSRA